jgi:hypothetical protein
MRERAYSVLLPLWSNGLARPRGEARHMFGLGVQAAHSTALTLTRPRAVAFTDCEVQRSLLISVVLVVLIERARMRPGG